MRLNGNLNSASIEPSSPNVDLTLLKSMEPDDQSLLTRIEALEREVKVVKELLRPRVEGLFPVLEMVRVCPHCGKHNCLETHVTCKVGSTAIDHLPGAGL